ncbi:DUF2827 domain-containing protein [Burkholderia reimsis]|uniref:DUF2827 domain-containing protein n=1 Tax=Burkholderia reimsis TaxID=2234132 RepID=A0A365QHH7_9BURK|nr:DUF2827 family protein [Burkholderia reimsis]RBB32227.1 DUF2827 domain-containing protein [Burkholderia reimsis]
MRVGISVLTHEGQSIWENGLGQNVFFLAGLLRSLPAVSQVLLINCGDRTTVPHEAEALAQGYPLMAARAATDLVDVVIEMSGGLDLEWVDYIRALGKKVIFMCCGQPYVGLIEPSIFERRGFFSRAERCDEIWVLGKDRAFIPMLRSLHRCPVFEVPYLWDPVFLDARAKQVEQNGHAFGYVLRRRRTDGNQPHGLKVAILEPNISVNKCFAVPALICDEAYRKDSRAIERLDILNSVHMAEHPTFTFLTRSLKLHEKQKVHFYARHDFVGYMSQHADAVVSHQWGNDQNYLYLDALYGGYPLVHNSPWLMEAGYFYEGSNVKEGAAMLLFAAYEHDAGHDGYMRRARALFSRLSPHDAGNRAAYAQRLLHASRQTIARAVGF